MVLSSKTVTTLKFLIDLGEKYSSNEFVSLLDVSKRKDISKKFLEQLVPPLKQNGLVLGNRGNQGGYKLAKAPKEITLKEIIEITELNILGKNNSSSQAIDEVLNGLDNAVENYLTKVTLQDLIDKEVASYSNSYCI